MKLNILKIIPDTIVDGPHIRTSIYVSGCKHYCPGCHNKDSWKFGSGKDYEIYYLVEMIKKYGNKYITLSGGDPFFQAKECYYLCKILKKEIPNINILVYTGYKLEDLKKSSDIDFKYLLLSTIDLLIDGPFIIDLKSDNVLYRGSTNQRFLKKDEDGEWILETKYD